MNKKFRLAILRELKTKEKKVIDITPYDLKVKEPESCSTRNWSLMVDINLKQTRPQDSLIPLINFSDGEKSTIKQHYPELFKELNWLLHQCKK